MSKSDKPRPAKVGRYEVVDHLGAGGMGTVYLATDPLLRRTVAIKVLPVHDEELRERFAREARSAASLRHNNIVTIYDVGEDDGKPFLAMEFIDGESMAELVRRRAAIDLDKRIRLMIDLCSGLGYAHRSGIIHRDIKPGNLMITSEGPLKILDFGLARITTDGTSTGLTTAGSLLGTPHYMSPEQIEGKAVDPRSDIFSVGLVLYELLTYQRAYTGESAHVVLHHIIHKTPRPMREMVPDIDPELVRIVDKATEKAPERRYQDLGALASDLEKVRERAAKWSDAATQIVERDRGAPSTPLSTPARDTRGRTNLDLLAQRRAAQVESHLKAANEHMAAGRYEDAVAECENAMLLDPQEPRALSLLGQAHSALDERQVRELLDQAKLRLAAGELTEAQALVEQTLMLRADNAEAKELKKQVKEQRAERERAAERARAAKSALDRAIRSLESGAFEAASRSASEVLAYEPTNEGALEVRRRAAEGIEARRRQQALDQRAAEVVEQARLRAAGGDPRGALTLLEGFDPPHPEVTAAIGRARTEVAALEKREREAAERERQRALEEQRRREAEEKARREAEEKARREAELKARREAEEKARREAEEKTRREAEEKARREAEEKARREAEEKARREAEEKARRDAEEKARREAELKARREAEEKARRDAEEKARRDAEEKARRAAEEKARRDAELKARRDAEEKARRDAEERARREAEEKARREAEEKTRRQAEEKARRDAEEKAREEKARRKAQEEEERLAALARSEETVLIERPREPASAPPPPAAPPPTPPPVVVQTPAPMPAIPAAEPLPEPAPAAPVARPPMAAAKFPPAVLGGVAAALLLLIVAGWYVTRDGVQSPAAEIPPATTAPQTPAKPPDSTAANPPVTPEPAPATPATTPGAPTVPEAEINRIHTAFTTAMRRNNLEQATRVMLEAPAAARSDRTIAADADRIVAAARQRAGTAQAQAQKTPAAFASADFRGAEARRLAAADLERRGQLPEAAREYLTAATGYARALTAKPPAVAEKADPTPTPPATTGTTATPPVNPPAPVTNPVPDPPTPIPTPAPPPPPSREPADTTAADAAAIRETLAQFVAGYENRDAAAIRRVYPSAPANLSFNNVRSYSLTLDAPQISISGDRATVRTVRRLRVQMAAGAPQQQALPTEFTMRRAGRSWVVDSIK
jgi:hypothetical protein